MENKTGLYFVSLMTGPREQMSGQTDVGPNKKFYGFRILNASLKLQKMNWME